MLRSGFNLKNSSMRLLESFFRIFLLACFILLAVGVPFVFVRKGQSAAILVTVITIGLLCWRMNRQGQPEKSLLIFSSFLLLVLIALMIGGVSSITVVPAMAMAILLGVVINLRAGVIYCVIYLLCWLIFIILNANGLMFEPYFPGTPSTQWLFGALTIWLVLMPIPELVLSLRKANSVQRAVIEATTDGILVVGNEGNVETYNQRFVDLWRISGEIVATQNDKAMLEFVVQQLTDPAQFIAKVEELYAHPEQSSFDTLHFKDGRVFERYSHPQRLDEQVVGRVWSFRDVTERELAQAEIHRLAHHDALTMLPNRRLLNDRLEQNLAASQRNNQNGAVLFMDLDNFKELNDTHGHGVGDQLLLEVTRRLSHCVRKVDTVARFGGDEFVVILGELDQDMESARLHAKRVAEKIQNELTQAYQLNGVNKLGETTQIFHHCTSSIGITMFPGPAASPEELLKRADKAMYWAKEAGRNAIRIYEDGIKSN
jgi:diguanylate cyclase (GGDEF)-like protein